VEAETIILSENSQKLVNLLQVLKVADHEGYHHSALDWFIFDARMTSPKTCELCQLYDMTDWRGDWVPDVFPYHTHMAVNAIKAMVHPNCRCVLRWAGRTQQLYETPLGLDIKQLWQVPKGELEQLSSQQLGFALEFIRNPWKVKT
jgi:hypothetical protein